LGHLGLNFGSLLWGVQGWTEWVAGEVSSNSDSCGLDHGGLIGGEVGGVKLHGSALSLMVICLLVTVIIFYNFIEEWSECSIGVVRSRVNSDSRIGVLASRVDGVLEWEVHFVLLADELVEKLSGQVLAQEGLGASWEDWEACELIGALQVGADLDIGGREFGSWGGGLVSKRSLVNFEWLGVGVLLGHAALSAWAGLFHGALGLLGRGVAVATILHGGVTSQVLGDIFSLHLVLNHHHGLVSDEFAVWPVASLELGENEHALVAHLEGAGSGDLLEVWGRLVLVWHEVVI
jgi:hypothetical protein